MDRVLLLRVSGVVVAGLATIRGATGQASGMADKSGYHLLNPTPRELMREMSTDRPDTTESPYTVDAGRVQIELSFIDYGVDTHNAEGVKTETVAIAPMLVKVGLLNSVDLQIGIDPHTRVRSKDRETGEAETARGFGNTLMRVKWNVWGNDEGETALAIMPWMSLPTSDDELGADDVEYGVIVPLGVQLPHDFSLGLMAEIDVVRSADDDRYVVDFVHSITIGRPLAGELSGYVEYAGFANLNHDEKYRGYLDTGVTYAVTEDVQLDAGIRVGLTEAAEDFGVFAGVSVRF